MFTFLNVNIQLYLKFEQLNSDSILFPPGHFKTFVRSYCVMTKQLPLRLLIAALWNTHSPTVSTCRRVYLCKWKCDVFRLMWFCISMCCVHEDYVSRQITTGKSSWGHPQKREKTHKGFIKKWNDSPLCFRITVCW